MSAPIAPRVNRRRKIRRYGTDAGPAPDARKKAFAWENGKARSGATMPGNGAPRLWRHCGRSRPFAVPERKRTDPSHGSDAAA